ncbi:hypothetical protein PhaeoP23_03927 (plasmid) [Phaeobacter piscinae]|uniref:Uncharacterized protein n=1 Tax=Phaeobacter piscinae TaxID=1580596 RepID=A0ABN5DL12_9RHOB|nr:MULTISPECIES: hypothetical protein [Phaeobacter]ATG38080.1 hypothetical protein PhaeoP36_04005 [Phaeobacter piscinae]AUQ88601.1 hypothetical protein PhaeoP42_04006 [Phaeobacter piscinae]AUQ92590.1 hypothetical protein PhaeoP24_04032 [Phaeobacter inhibens]AUR26406.1 hypothetical protein PhaeoP23_03927 [Phaeobacter piscinae]
MSTKDGNGNIPVDHHNSPEDDAYVPIDELKTNFDNGWVIELECTTATEEYYAGYRGLWVFRCVSDGVSKTLATFREKKQPREIKTSGGVEKIIRKELGASKGVMVYEPGEVVRFDKDGPLR